jgi:hypothetical protein
VLPFILFTINWQIAMPSIGRSSLFYSIKIGRFPKLFSFCFECLESFFEILKWQNLVSFYIKFPKQSNKTSLAALTAGLFTPNGIGEYAGKAMFFDKSATKKLFLNLIMESNDDLTVILGFWFAVF